MNLKRSDNSETIRKRLNALLSISMGKLAVTLGTTLTAERIQSYLEPLSDLSESDIERAFKVAAKQFKPRFSAFPSPAELREYAQQNMTSTFIDDSKKYLSMKRPDAEPMTADEARSLIEKLREEKK